MRLTEKQYRLAQAQADKAAAVSGSPGQSSEEASKPAKKPRANPRADEHKQQAILFSRVHQWEKAYPVLELVYCVRNGGSGMLTDGQRLYMYAEGLRAGVPDVNVDAIRVFRGVLRYGLRIEMKVNGNKPSAAQERMHRMMIKEGFLVFVMQDGLAAWALVAEYLGLPKELWV